MLSTLLLRKEKAYTLCIFILTIFITFSSSFVSAARTKKTLRQSFQICPQGSAFWSYTATHYPTLFHFDHQSLTVFASDQSIQELFNCCANEVAVDQTVSLAFLPTFCQAESSLSGEVTTVDQKLSLFSKSYFVDGILKTGLIPDNLPLWAWNMMTFKPPSQLTVDSASSLSQFSPNVQAFLELVSQNITNVKCSAFQFSLFFNGNNGLLLFPNLQKLEIILDQDGSTVSPFLSQFLDSHGASLTDLHFNCSSLNNCSDIFYFQNLTLFKGKSNLRSIYIDNDSCSSSQKLFSIQDYHEIYVRNLIERNLKIPNVLKMNVFSLFNKFKGKYAITRERLGEGVTGTVMLGYKMADLTKVAVKIYNTTDVDTAASEMELLTKYSTNNHPNVVKLIDHFIVRERSGALMRQATLIYEMVEGTTLENLIKTIQTKNDKLNFTTGPLINEHDAKKIIQDILSGLKYLHSFGIIHKDLKSDNIMIDANGNAKIIDFGHSVCLFKKPDLTFLMDVEHGLALEAYGNLGYAGPESFKSVVNEKSDIWALGNIAFEMISGHLVYEKYFQNPLDYCEVLENWLRPENGLLDQEEKEIVTHEEFELKAFVAAVFINNHSDIVNLENISDSFKSFIDVCLTKDYAVRPGAGHLLAHHPFFLGSNEEQLPYDYFLQDEDVKMSS